MFLARIPKGVDPCMVYGSLTINSNITLANQLDFLPLTLVRHNLGRISIMYQEMQFTWHELRTILLTTWMLKEETPASLTTCATTSREGVVSAVTRHAALCDLVDQRLRKHTLVYLSFLHLQYDTQSRHYVLENGALPMVEGRGRIFLRRSERVRASADNADYNVCYPTRSQGTDSSSPSRRCNHFGTSTS